MARLAEFVFLEEPDDKNRLFILHTKLPFYVGQVWKFRSDDDLAAFMANNEGYTIAPCDGYRICVKKYATLMPASDDDMSKSIIHHMADFYTENRIIPNASYFRKFQKD